jgi:hypothetical protein
MSLPSDDLFSRWSEVSPSPSTSVCNLHFESPFRGERALPDDSVAFVDTDSATKTVDAFTSLPPAIHQITGMYAPLPLAFPFGFHGQLFLAPPARPDDRFEEVLADTSEIVNPRQLGFIPVSAWLDQDMTFGQLVESFFQRKNCSQGRFSHKLFNALRLATAAPHLVRFIGVDWVTRDVIRVHKLVFGRLLKIKAIDGSLFHQQGNFPTYGFAELTEHDARNLCSSDLLLGIDYETVRLLRHSEGKFTKDSTGDDVEKEQWASPRRVRDKAAQVTQQFDVSRSNRRQ